MRALQYTRRYSKLAGVVVGAIPPLIGWAAVDGKLQLAAPCAPITREQVTYPTVRPTVTSARRISCHVRDRPGHVHADEAALRVRADGALLPDWPQGRNS